MTGGYDGFEARKRVAVYNTKTNKNAELPFMNEGRYAHASIFLADYLYVFGGIAIRQRYQCAVCSCERIKPGAETAWTMLA